MFCSLVFAEDLEAGDPALMLMAISFCIVVSSPLDANGFDDPSVRVPAARDGADDLEEASDALLFPDEGGGTRSDRLAAGVGIVLQGKNNDAGRWLLVCQGPGGFDAAEPAHSQVQDHNVRGELGGQSDRGSPFLGLANDIEVGFSGHAHAQALANPGFIVDEEEANRGVNHVLNSREGTAPARHAADWLGEITSGERNLLPKAEEGSPDSR